MSSQIMVNENNDDSFFSSVTYGKLKRVLVMQHYIVGSAANRQGIG